MQRRRWRLTANASKDLVGRLAQQPNAQNHGIVALRCRVDQISHDGRATRTERAVNEWLERVQEAVLARAWPVGVSLVASICWVSGHRDGGCPDITRDSDSRAVAVVCSGEDYDEDEDGKDGEKPRATRVRSNKTRGAQTLRRSPSAVGSLAPSGGFRKLEADEANTLFIGALCFAL